MSDTTQVEVYNITNIEVGDTIIGAPGIFCAGKTFTVARVDPPRLIYTKPGLGCIFSCLKNFGCVVIRNINNSNNCLYDIDGSIVSSGEVDDN